MNAAALLVAAQHELDGAVHQGHHQVGVFLAWHAKDARNPLGLETTHEKI